MVQLAGTALVGCKNPDNLLAGEYVEMCSYVW
jgi:hypothetical protein